MSLCGGSVLKSFIFIVHLGTLQSGKLLKLLLELKLKLDAEGGGEEESSQTDRQTAQSDFYLRNPSI